MCKTTETKKIKGDFLDGDVIYEFDYPNSIHVFNSFEEVKRIIVSDSLIQQMTFMILALQ